MLTDLTIKNIAIIDSLQIGFRDGLTVLSGETGAGKSIIIDAVGLIMGGRASSDLIRSGEDEAVVEALFDLSGLPDVRDQLAAGGFECEGELLVKRSISRAGKNRIFLNGSMATLALLTEIAPRLVNIYGQHDSQTLLKPENHLMLLDAFGTITARRQQFAATFAALADITERMEHLARVEREAAQRLDLLAYQLEEIERVAPKPGETDELEERRRLLASAERLERVTGEAFERLYGSDDALLGHLRRICSSIADLGSIDPALQETAATIENAYLQLEDAAMTLRDYASRIEADPLALQQVDDRLDQLGRLCKKYGGDAEAVLAYQREIAAEIEELRSGEIRRHDLEQERDRLEELLRCQGEELSAARRAAALGLKQALETELHQLAMKGAVIDVALEPLPAPRASGMERVEFLFSPNQGEPPRPLARIASGGELSRLMLAIKQILPESDVPTLVFDEVDTGISGATSELVGKKLRNVARRQQVLCITHLPQVAACATHHLHVEKRVSDGRTRTAVVELDREGRTREVARMIAGATISDSALRHAAEMLDSSGASSPAV